MEQYLKSRPQKTIYSLNIQKELRDKAIDKIKSSFLPNDKIIKIVLIGSSVKESFGEYQEPGFRGSLYSDFDFIVFVENDYEIPGWLTREPDGKPFQDDKLNLAYRNKKFIDDKYDIEIFFVRENNMNNKEIQEEGENAGMPMKEDSKNKSIAIYQR